MILTFKLEMFRLLLKKFEMLQMLLNMKRCGETLCTFNI